MLFCTKKISETSYEVYDTRTWTTKVLSVEELHNEGVVGVSGDDITTYDTLNDYLQCMKLQSDLFGGKNNIIHEESKSRYSEQSELFLKNMDADFVTSVIQENGGTLDMTGYAIETTTRFQFPRTVRAAQEIDCTGMFYCGFRTRERYPKRDIGYIEQVKDFSVYPELQTLRLPFGGFAIAESEFAHSENLRRVLVQRYAGHSDKRVKSILRASAFKGCSNLQQVDLSGFVLETIPESCFENSGISEIALPDGVYYIWRYAFKGCKNLTHITLPDSVADMSAECFRGSGLVSFKVPKKITYLRDASFADCPNLKSIDLRYVETVGSNAFLNCPELENVRFGNKLNFLDPGIFVGCTKLKEVNVPRCITPETFGGLGHDSVEHITFLFTRAFAKKAELSEPEGIYKKRYRYRIKE